VELVGDLTIRGTTLPVTATGRLAGPRRTRFGEVAGLGLRATLDRRAFGLEWQAELPDGGDAVGWDVEVNIDLLLLKAADVPA
jgi:polyisoprenoid-binding protein YceI